MCHTLQSPGVHVQECSPLGAVWLPPLTLHIRPGRPSLSLSLSLTHSALHFTARPCRRRSECQPVELRPSDSCMSPSSLWGRYHRPTAWTSPCRSPTQHRLRNDMAAPAGGLLRTPAGSGSGSGICSLRCTKERKRQINRLVVNVVNVSLLNFFF